MDAFTGLEWAVLRSIFPETPDLAGALDRQMIAATVMRRENTGAGFFTAITVPSLVPRVNGPRVLGCETHARIPGLEDGLGFVLFLEDGRLSLLEGYAWGPESTAALDLLRLEFEVYRAPVPRLG